jgi:hypothetical protein
MSYIEEVGSFCVVVEATQSHYEYLLKFSLEYKLSR